MDGNVFFQTPDPGSYPHLWKEHPISAKVVYPRDVRVGRLISAFLIRPHADPKFIAILDFVRAQGYRVEVARSICCTHPNLRSLIETEYDEHKDKPFFEPLVSSMTTEFPNNYISLVTVRKPRHSICRDDKPMWSVVRELCGATDPSKAESGTIRGKFAEKDKPIRYNVVHSPDSYEAAVAFYERWMTFKI